MKPEATTLEAEAAAWDECAERIARECDTRAELIRERIDTARRFAADARERAMISRLRAEPGGDPRPLDRLLALAAELAEAPDTMPDRAATLRGALARAAVEAEALAELAEAARHVEARGGAGMARLSRALTRVGYARRRD